MRIGIIAALVILSQGCAHHQLRFITTKQAHTVEDVHTQQVLDNLAKFAANPNAMPHFSWPNSGSSNVNTSVNGGAGFNFTPQRLASWMFNFGGTRAATEAYTVTPINDPRKLELMRCAYQRAVSSCCCTGESGCCPDCEKRFNKFYLGSESPSKVRSSVDGKPMSEATVVMKISESEYLLYEDTPVYAETNEYNETIYRMLDHNPGQQVFIVYSAQETSEGIVGDHWLVKTERKNGGKTIYELIDSTPGVVSKGDTVNPRGDVYIQDGQDQPAKAAKGIYEKSTIAINTNASGKVTSECLLGPCWFKAGKKCDVPKWSRCAHVGHYCGCYVWVPECGRDQLTKLTLAILDIALNDPPTGRTKEVVAYLDAKQQPTTKSMASYKVTATVPLSGSASAVHPSASADAVAEAKLNVEQAKAAYDQRFSSLLSNETAYGQLSLMSGGLPKAADLTPDQAVGLKDVITQLLSDESSRKQLSLVAPMLVSDYWKLRSAELRLDAANNSLRNAPAIEAERAALEYLPPARTPVPNAGYLQFQQNLDALAPR